MSGIEPEFDRLIYPEMLISFFTYDPCPVTTVSQYTVFEMGLYFSAGARCMICMNIRQAFRLSRMYNIYKKQPRSGHDGTNIDILPVNPFYGCISYPSRRQIWS
jgi:hypothetical protein